MSDAHFGAGFWILPAGKTKKEKGKMETGPQSCARADKLLPPVFGTDVIRDHIEH